MDGKSTTTHCFSAGTYFTTTQSALENAALPADSWTYSNVKGVCIRTFPRHILRFPRHFQDTKIDKPRPSEPSTDEHRRVLEVQFRIHGQSYDLSCPEPSPLRWHHHAPQQRNSEQSSQQKHYAGQARFSCAGFTVANFWNSVLVSRDGDFQLHEQ